MGWGGEGMGMGMGEALESFEGSWGKRGRRMMTMRVRGMRRLRTGGKLGRVCGR